MSQGIDLVVDRFGERELVIRRLNREDPDFREMCDDYRDVLDALGRSTSEADRREFERLRADLEEEIAARLSGTKG